MGIERKNGPGPANRRFEDPVTGKKGVMTPAGKILVPAEYDEFVFTGNINRRLTNLPAIKDGKYGLVAADGTGKPVCEFRFDWIDWTPFGILVAKWDGVKDKFGLIDYNGKVMIPNVLTRIYRPWNDFVKLEANGKFGALDIYTYHCIVPEYDLIVFDKNDELRFRKDGVWGYVIEETGEFIPKELRNDEKYYDAYVFTAANHL